MNIRQNPASTSNYTVGRSKGIDKIILHHAATTSFDGIGATFKNPSRGVSAHYGVGQNGNIDQYVQEKDTAWHAGNWDANSSSIGIENVNSSGAPNWDIADSTIDTLVELVRDIATRHGLMPVQVGKNLFQHKNFVATYCAGKVGDRLQEIADRVNGGTPTPAPTPKPNEPDQILEVGSKIVFNQVYRVDNMAMIGGIWQVQTNALCREGFTWDDNGIPVMPLVLTDRSGNRTQSQVTNPGKFYKIPGTYTVLNLGQYKHYWLAQIDMGGWKLWVDVETATEV